MFNIEHIISMFFFWTQCWFYRTSIPTFKYGYNTHVHYLNVCHQRVMTNFVEVAFIFYLVQCSNALVDLIQYFNIGNEECMNNGNLSVEYFRVSRV